MSTMGRADTDLTTRRRLPACVVPHWLACLRTAKGAHPHKELGLAEVLGQPPPRQLLRDQPDLAPAIVVGQPPRRRVAPHVIGQPLLPPLAPEPASYRPAQAICNAWILTDFVRHKAEQGAVKALTNCPMAGMCLNSHTQVHAVGSRRADGSGAQHHGRPEVQRRRLRVSTDTG